MKRFSKFFLAIAMFMTAFSVFANDVNTLIVEINDREIPVAFFTCNFVTAEVGPVLLIGYYPLEDVMFFMPEFTVEQEGSIGKYDIYGIDEKIRVLEPAWYDLGDNLPAKQFITMYIILPYNFSFNKDTTIYFETYNGVMWHQFLADRETSDEKVLWHNGKRLDN